MNKLRLIAKTIFLTSLYLFSISGIGQCPENSYNIEINTQVQYDSLKLKYPNCREFSIITVDNKFLGDFHPKPIRYIILLVLILVAIIKVLGWLFNLDWFVDGG